MFIIVPDIVHLKLLLPHSSVVPITSFFFLSHYSNYSPCGRVCLCISSYSQTHQHCKSQHLYLNMSVPCLTMFSLHYVCVCVWEGYDLNWVFTSISRGYFLDDLCGYSIWGIYDTSWLYIVSPLGYFWGHISDSKPCPEFRLLGQWLRFRNDCTIVTLSMRSLCIFMSHTFSCQLGCVNFSSRS